MTRPSLDRIVDAFVDRVNRAARERLPEEDVPEFLRVGKPDEYGHWSWRILASAAPNDWIAPLEARLPGRLPPSYRSLAERYLFPSFGLGPAALFGCAGTEHHLELAHALFMDHHLAGALLRAGFVQIGRPADGSYDAVAFDLGRRRGGGECPLVRLDHEAALAGDEARVVEDLAPSFLALLEAWKQEA